MIDIPVTVSMGELTKGVFNVICFVKVDVKSCKPMTKMAILGRKILKKYGRTSSIINLVIAIILSS